jgi:hypothetical protein
MSFGKEAKRPSTLDLGIGLNCLESRAIDHKLVNDALGYGKWGHTLSTPGTDGRCKDDLE